MMISPLGDKPGFVEALENGCCEGRAFSRVLRFATMGFPKTTARHPIG